MVHALLQILEILGEPLFMGIQQISQDLEQFVLMLLSQIFQKIMVAV
jgi:hypothetical protein